MADSGNDFDRVTTHGLTKLYGGTRALVDASVSFTPGITVVEGPNGSGKSTLLSLLAQTARPTDGHITYGGKKRAGQSIRRHLGVLSHDAMLYPDLTGAQNLAFFADLYGLPKQGAARIAELRERFQVGRFFDRPVRTYSRGQVQRVALCRALLHAPRLLLLDEPTNGLDRASLERLTAVVGDERDRGAIIVLVTHDADFAAPLAERRVRLRAGKIEGTSEAAA